MNKAAESNRPIGDARARVTVVEADITTLDVDAIVNAANPGLLGGGGVDGAIHAAAGPELVKECRALVTARGRCRSGDAVITGAGRLPMRYVIHAVGPVWHGGQQHEARLLASAYRRSLELAGSHQLRRIAFPNISTGVYGYPKAAAAPIAVETVCRFLGEHPLPEAVVFCCFDVENARLYERLLGTRGCAPPAVA
ncbi:MAG TPA: O-acetyl-ADP-ribose deacetylase [Rhodanobacteraceae bacterium]|nr:O-acetyl-ADP-ribose deacetylase [Rhodanobacteraceae bacterium]